mgnify:CR=1 FL=1
MQEVRNGTGFKMKRKFLLVGSWDMFHYAHLLMIRKAKSLSDAVGGEIIVGVNTDSLNIKYKKRKAIIPYKHRFEIIRSLREVDEAVPNYIYNLIPLIKRHKITDYALSREWVDRKAKEISYLKSIGCKVHIFPRSKTISSTDIRNKILRLSGIKHG